MAIETLGEAWHAGWQIDARCTRDTLTWLKRIHPCRWRRPMDMVTLVTTRGEAFPLALLASRMRCPECGDRNVAILFQPPSQRDRRALRQGRP